MKKPSDLRIINPQRRAESYKSVVFSDFVFRFQSLNPTTTGLGGNVALFWKTLSFLYQSHFGEDESYCEMRRFVFQDLTPT